MLDRINDLLSCLITKTRLGELSWYSDYYPKGNKNLYAGIFYEFSGAYKISRFTENMDMVILTISECNIMISTVDIPIIETQEKLFKLFLEVYWRCSGYYPNTASKLDELILKL